MTYEHIPKIENEKIIKAKIRSSITLPDNPSERGLSSSQIKKALSAPLDITFEELNLLIDKLNIKLAPLELRVTLSEKVMDDNCKILKEQSNKIVNIEKETHSHANFSLLNEYTVSNEDIKTAIKNNHEHFKIGCNKTMVVIEDEPLIQRASYKTVWEIISEQLGFDSFTVVNKDSLKENETIVTGDVIILSLGKSESIDLETFSNELSEAIQKLIDNNPDARIMCVTPVQIFNCSVESYRDVIQETSLKYAIPVIDAYALSGMVINHGQADSEYNLELSVQKISDDGKNLNEKGHRILAKRLLKLVENLV